MHEVKPRNKLLVMMAGHDLILELGLYLVQLESSHVQVVHKTIYGLVYPHMSKEL
jgi:hypothetical protein